MDNRSQAKLYYLYMMADGDVSEHEIKLFESICKELYIETEEKNSIIKECHDIVNKEKLNCLKVLEMNAGEISIDDYSLLDLDINKYKSDVGYGFFLFEHENYVKEKTLIIWNLINLGYADGYYTIYEIEVVKFLLKYWNIKDSLYEEMIDVAETILSLVNHKKWVEETMPESIKRKVKLIDIENNIKFVQDTIKTTISELE